jgi:hypothetical protein
MIYKRWITFKTDLKDANYAPIFYVISYDKINDSYIYLRSAIHSDGYQEIQLLNNKNIERFNFEKRENIVDYKNSVNVMSVLKKVLESVFTENMVEKDGTLVIHAGNWKVK